ncbi:putative dehydrogenase [Paenibacillus cellulosilyticus]|uniref:Putative dehydrogenase n=1 Tax=Paenibacillus cellulosilyticus TaxID=375489 RepID=A0A2V2Z0T2_9BACL|nr:Gfo/Idh/MocA family oxidoreductase [Paenibacillus cellulosilyticus]PWW08684.1 putative dehydrogenase [Paenibacillus cellulosilyticus]QKS48250.1 Gfo/Idh/MocA family oxidoreductase [Paenibacillus cellulosilyticus]
MSKKLKWGIMGCAKIAQRAVIPGLHLSELNEAAAIASRDADKAKRTAEELNIGTAYDSYEALLADPSIDVIYIPLPNHLHKEWAIRAAEAGKHILCEKPLALNAHEAAEMAEAADKAGVLLSEAFMYRYHPRYDQIRDLIASGAIGEIRGIRSAFTFNNPNDSANVRFRKDWGGGSIYDVGCYPINAARLLLGQEPEAVTVNALFSPQHDDVDMMASGLIEFGGNVSLTFDCGMWAAFRNPLEVLGTDGIIEVPSAFVTPSEESGHIYLTTGGERRKIEVPYVNAYTEQADSIARSIASGTRLAFATSDAIRNMKVIDACLLSARERTRVTL